MSIDLLDMNKTTIYISAKTSYKVAKLSKEHLMSYEFVVKLRSMVHHPILLNHTANLTAYRTLLCISDKSYRQLLNMAIRFGYASYEGSNLRLLSRSQERLLFNTKTYKNITVSDIRPFTQMSILEHNIKQQQLAFRHKSTPKQTGGAYHCDKMPKQPFVKLVNNDQITLSVKSAANLLNVSYTHAYTSLRKLKGYGLSLTQNSVDISKSDFKYLLATGNKSIRYTKGRYYYIGASTAHIKNKFNVTVTSSPKPQPMWDNDNW